MVAAVRFSSISKGDASMFRTKTGLFSLLALVVIALSEATPDGTILIDNFDDGLAANWDQNDFTGCGVFDASSGAYNIRSSCPIAIDDPSAGSIESHWLPSLSAPRFASGTFRATM